MVDADDLTGAYGLPVPIYEEYPIPDQADEEIDTLNSQMVAMQGETIVVMFPRPMTADDALVHAAWLVALAEHVAEHSFADVLEAVRNT